MAGRRGLNMPRKKLSAQQYVGCLIMFVCAWLAVLIWAEDAKVSGHVMVALLLGPCALYGLYLFIERPEEK